MGYYAIQTHLSTDPCARWDWGQALFWGGVGTGIGAILGSGIYGGWWIWTTLGTTSYVTADPLTLTAKREYWNQMYSTFLRAYPRFQQFVQTKKMQIHHRIPLQWAHLFPGIDPNRLSNLVALPTNIHQQIVTPAWNTFAKANSMPSAAEVLKFAIDMDKIIAEFINRIPR